MPNHVNHHHSFLSRFVPFLDLIRDYRTSYIRPDFIAGLTVSVVLIPQAMAYAMLAGLPAFYGLYAATLTPFIGAIWGSLRQLATGPIAIMSLLVFTSLSPIAEPGSREFIELTFLLSFMVGVIYMGIGLFRLGELMSFVSHSAIKGFTSAAALIIIATQMVPLLGLKVSSHEYIFPMLVELIRKLPSLHIPTVIIGITSFIIIYSFKRYKPNFPSGLMALTLASLAVVLLGLDEKGVALVDTPPKGLPAFQIPIMGFDVISSLIGPAVVIALVSFAETYSVGKMISAQTKQRVDVDQEFVGQGLANLVGSFFQGYPVSGSFSRTAINYGVGGKTAVSSVVTSLVLVFALLFFTPLLGYIPRAALAALVISAVLILFHPKEVFVLWKINRHDGIVGMTVFILALLTKPDYALLIGVMISLMLFLWKTMHPRLVRVTKDPELNMFLNADTYERPTCPQIVHLRSDNIIYFANADYTVEHILEAVDEVDTPVKFLLLDFQGVGFIDITGVDELTSLYDELKSMDIELALMSVHQPVRDVLESSGFLDTLKPGHLIENRGDAIKFLFDRLDHEYCRDVCPYILYFECSSAK